jgi:hypothetical protein
VSAGDVAETIQRLIRCCGAGGQWHIGPRKQGRFLFHVESYAHSNMQPMTNGAIDRRPFIKVEECFLNRAIKEMSLKKKAREIRCAISRKSSDS